jgi:hypothetical protein
VTVVVRFGVGQNFSLLAPDDRFDLSPYCGSVEDELISWGFPATVAVKAKTERSAVESAFLKANTRELLLTIEAGEMASAIHGRRELKIKIELDTDPPRESRPSGCFRPGATPRRTRGYENGDRVARLPVAVSLSVAIHQELHPGHGSQHRAKGYQGRW